MCQTSVTIKLTHRRLFFLIGGPIAVAIYQLPQAFQLVYGLSGLDSGVRVIPFTVFWSFGIIGASMIAGKLKVPPIYLIFVGSAFQIIGFGLLGTLPLTLTIPPQIYGYQILAGLGCGMIVPLLFALIPVVVELRDKGT